MGDSVNRSRRGSLDSSTDSDIDLATAANKTGLTGSQVLLPGGVAAGADSSSPAKSEVSAFVESMNILVNDYRRELKEERKRFDEDRKKYMNLILEERRMHKEELREARIEARDERKASSDLLISTISKLISQIALIEPTRQTVLSDESRSRDDVSENDEVATSVDYEEVQGLDWTEQHVPYMQYTTVPCLKYDATAQPWGWHSYA